jgi:hypothetical protein
MRAQLRPEHVVDVVGVERHALGETESHFFVRGEVASFLERREIGQLLFRIAEALCQSAV